MIIRFDLERRMSDPVVLGEQGACPIEHAVRFGAGSDDQMCRHDLHLRGQRPHVEVVHVDNPIDRGDVGLQRR